METKKKPETLEEALNEIDLLNCRVEYEMSLNKSCTKELARCEEKLKAIQSIITL
jgi:hypothetical protein